MSASCRARSCKGNVFFSLTGRLHREGVGNEKKSTDSTFVFLISIFFVEPAFAYPGSFASEVTKITAPADNALNFPGYVTIAGTSQLEQIWLCVRGPAGEVVNFPIKVNENTFDYELNLRFGAGTYTIWVGDALQNFDGKIRFEVINTLDTDLRYSSPSAYIDSNHETVTKLCSSIITPEMTDSEKLEAIYQWVTQNISYDYIAYKKQNTTLKPASLIIQKKKGMCRDYSFAVAALARASGLQARIVYGQARRRSNGRSEEHAWNEVYLDGNWISLDATWDAGSRQQRYFNPDSRVFARTHQAETITLH
jgi:hypothetical protein